jgi:hypothetical protein
MDEGGQASKSAKSAGNATSSPVEKNAAGSSSSPAPAMHQSSANNDFSSNAPTNNSLPPPSSGLGGILNQPAKPSQANRPTQQSQVMSPAMVGLSRPASTVTTGSASASTSPAIQHSTIPRQHHSAGSTSRPVTSSGGVPATVSPRQAHAQRPSSSSGAAPSRPPSTTASSTTTPKLPPGVPPPMKPSNIAWPMPVTAAVDVAMSSPVLNNSVVIPGSGTISPAATMNSPVVSSDQRATSYYRQRPGSSGGYGWGGGGQANGK